MNRREARKKALNAAATVLDATAQDIDCTLYADLSDEDAIKVSREMQRIANGLGMQFARLVEMDVYRARAAARETI